MKYYYKGDLKKIIIINDKYKIIGSIDNLYELLMNVWCNDTCAPRLRYKWCEKRKTIGQCSITSFLVQEIFGGDVYGVEVDCGIHCFNKIDDIIVDLTSSQFDYQLNYEKCKKQDKKEHFMSEEKRMRYEYLKEKLDEEIKKI